MKCKDTLTKEQTEALEAVQKLNNEMHDKYGWNNENLPIFSITIASYMFFISVGIGQHDIQLYNSGDDDRMYYEATNTTEKFYSHIRRKFREYKYLINEFKI